jgi:hypothetical protein
VESLILRLWIQFGLETESTGSSGFLSDASVHCFEKNIPFEIQNVIEKLVACGLLKRVEGGFRADMFVWYNQSLDVNFIDDNSGKASYATFLDQQEIAGTESNSILAKLSPLCFQEGTRKREAAEVRKIMMLIKTLDGIFGLPRRKPENYDPGIMDAAGRLLAKYPYHQIEIVLLRMWQKRGNLGIPKKTSWFLENFEEAQAKIAPPDGYTKWMSEKSGHTLSLR